jgi:outer membrane protein assembly factor BamD (BamD/ComL family)
MKRSMMTCFFSCVFLLLGSQVSSAQFAVFDASNYAAALQEFHQLQQTYTTALETRDEIIATYNLAYQMSQMPQDLAARYQADFSQWTSLSAPDTYGNTAAWVNALNIGNPAQASQAYASAVVQVENYPNSSYSTLDTNSQATIQNQFATSELAQGMTIGTLETLGTVRSDSEAFAQQLANLDADTFSTDPTQQTEMAVLGKINSATLLQVHSQQDANQILAASVEQQLISQKQQIDAQNRTINLAIYFQQNFPTVMGNITTGVSDAIHAISLSPAGR